MSGQNIIHEENMFLIYAKQQLDLECQTNSSGGSAASSTTMRLQKRLDFYEIKLVSKAIFFRYMAEHVR